MIEFGSGDVACTTLQILAMIAYFDQLDSQQMFKRQLKQLNYWIITAICHSLQILTWLPYRWQMILGRFIGTLAYHFSSKSRRIAKINIELCFPQKNPAEKAQLLKSCFASVGMGFFESLLAAYGSKRLLRRLTGTLSGIDAVRQALDSGEGVIILFPHLIPMYLVGRLATNHTKLPFSLMYHAPKNKALNDFFRYHLSSYCPQAFTRTDVSAMVKYLREGNIVWYAPDLDIGSKRSSFIPFFNIPAATLVAPLKITKMTNAKVFPIQFYRRDDFSGYDIEILPALENFPSDDPIADLTRINQIVEQSIRIKPEQYLWIYKRFSTRPNGEPKYY